MLQADHPDTYVLATGRTESVRDFVSLAFAEVDMRLQWRGQGIDEVGVDAKGQVRVRINPRFYRPAEVELLIGDPAKARIELGWQARTTLEDLCKLMVQADLARVEHDRSF